jgi:hypothetical protein
MEARQVGRKKEEKRANLYLRETSGGQEDVKGKVE